MPFGFICLPLFNSKVLNFLIGEFFLFVLFFVFVCLFLDGMCIEKGAFLYSSRETLDGVWVCSWLSNEKGLLLASCE